MRGRHTDGGDHGSVPADRAAAYRRAASRPPVSIQVERLLAELATLDAFRATGETRLARGAALSLAHAALVLAVTPAIGDADRRRRREALRDTILPRLAEAGLAHVGTLAEAALAHDADPAAVVQAHTPPQ